MAVRFLKGVDNNNQALINVADPSGNTDAANKQYVDGRVMGLAWKAPVRAATVGAGTLASSFANGQSIDGVTLVTGDRILIKDQSSGTENGIYTVNASGAPTRATDMDSNAEAVNNTTVAVMEGSSNADKAFTLTNNGTITLGSTALTWAVIGGNGTTYTADGQGIELSSTTFSLELDGTTLSKSASGLRVGSGAAGNGLTESSGVLAVGAGTGISVAADTVGVDTSVVVRKYAADCAATTNPQTFTHSLGTKDVQVKIRRAADDVFVEADVTATSTTQVTVDFGGAPTAAQYRVIVQG